MIAAVAELPEIRYRNKDAEIALRLGCYDLLHAGHLEGLQVASDQADILVVGVASDERVQQLKGPERPIIPEQSRLESVDAVEVVDYSFIMPTHWFGRMQAHLRLREDVYVESAEKSLNPLKSVLMSALGVRYVVDDAEKIDSTTDIIARNGFIKGMPLRELEHERTS